MSVHILSVSDRYSCKVDFSDVHIGVDYYFFFFFFFMINQLLNVHIVVDIDFSDVIKRKKEENKTKEKRKAHNLLITKDKSC